MTGRKDYWGFVVDIAKRIEGKAEPGDISVSDAFLAELGCLYGEYVEEKLRREGSE